MSTDLILQDTSFAVSIKEHGEPIFVQRGSLLFMEDETATNIYLIISGKLKVSRVNISSGKEQTLNILSKGDMYDIVSVLDTSNASRDNIVSVLEDSQLLKLPIKVVKDWIYSSPAFSEFFFKYVADQISHLENVSEDLALEKTSTRLMKLILESTDINSKKYKLLDNLNHEEIAALIGSVRAVVNRDLQKLKEENIIDISRKKISLIDREALSDKIM